MRDADGFERRKAMPRSSTSSVGVESKVTAAPTPTPYHSVGGYSSLAEIGGCPGGSPSERSSSPLDPAVVHVSGSSPTFAGETGSSEHLLACHRYSRAIRVLAVLDAIVVLYGVSAFTPLILMMWGPIAGYMSSNFQLRSAYAFLFYYGLRVSWDIGWLLSGGITWIIVWVFLVTDVAASALVYFYLALLRKCTPAEVELLRHPATPWAPTFFPLTVHGTLSPSAS